jgi:alpha-tubulin suppressor-like RCC1 family protein
LWTWGDGQFGALGDGTTVDKSSPVQVGSLTDWDRVYAGRQHTFGIKTDGTLWVWGFNQYGGNGTGNTTYYSSPVQVGSLTNWASLGPGSEYTAAVKTDGTLWAWGRNASGQLGTGNTTDYSSPVQIGSLTDWKQVSCHVGMNSPSRGGWLAVKTDGTLWGTGTQTTTTGANTGEIGVGNTTTYSSPVQIGSLTDWKNVVSVHYASQAIKTDGTMWTWGRGYYGTGLGDRTDRSSPAQVGSDTTWQQVGTTAANTTYFGLKDA